METGWWLSGLLPVSACICNFLAVLRLDPPYVGRLWCNRGMFLTLSRRLLWPAFQKTQEEVMAIGDSADGPNEGLLFSGHV